MTTAVSIMRLKVPPHRPTVVLLFTSTYAVEEWQF